MKWRSVRIDGNATFTTAMSRTTMNWATQIAARMYHLRLSHGERTSAGYTGWSARVGRSGVANGLSSLARDTHSAICRRPDRGPGLFAK